MSESNETPNEFEEAPTAAPDEPVKTPAEETAPNVELSDAVKEAIAKQGVTRIDLAPCPCGAQNVNLMLELDANSKIGRASCGSCGAWGIDFLAPRTQDKELVGRAAAKAWNEAPRPA